VKILETLARGLPVISTSIGCEGIEAVPGVHLLAADTPADFAAEVNRAFQDQALVDRLARAGRELVLSRYDSEVVGAELRRVLSGFRLAPASGASGRIADKSPQ
jgi:polysaccharide biosynthesis protein PslH